MSDGERLAGARCSKQNLRFVPPTEALLQFDDGRGLVTGGGVGRDELEHGRGGRLQVGEL
jgi:hypothetical protein